MTFILLILLLITFLILITFLEKRTTQSSINKKNQKSYIYGQKKIMTESEKKFYEKLKKIETDIPIIVHPQLVLASIIKKENYNKYINELFKIVDFAIFSNNYEKILLLVELNDQSHKYAKRKKRDLKVKEICDSVGIKIINFYTNYENKEEYIKERIKKEIDMVNKNEASDSWGGSSFAEKSN